MAKISLDSDGEYIIGNKKIAAIKALQNATSLGLKDAKNLVDKMFVGETVEYDLSPSEIVELSSQGYHIFDDEENEKLYCTAKAAIKVKEAMLMLLEVDQNHYLALLNNAYKQMKEEIDSGPTPIEKIES